MIMHEAEEKNRMVKEIAVIGACCSRDIFNHKFIVDWKERYNLLYYAFQTSIISLMSKPIPYSRMLLNCKCSNYSEWYRNIFERELNKSFLNDLYSLQPENLLIDYYSDCIMGCLEIENGKSYLSQRTKDQNNNAAYLLLNISKEIKPIYDEQKYMSLWQSAVTDFFNWCKVYIPKTRIIINRPYFVDDIKYSDGRMNKYEGWDVDFYNDLYERMVIFTKSIVPDVQVIDLGKSYSIDPDYIFGGAWITHYEKKYYMDLDDRLYEVLQIQSDGDNVDVELYPINLILNNDYRYGSLFWKYWDKRFKYDSAEKIISIQENGNDCPIYAQIWSCDIIVRTDCEYVLSFDCQVHSDSEYDKDYCVLIRSFEKQNVYSRRDAIDQIGIRMLSSDINHYTHKEISFIPKARYISVGCYCFQNGHIDWKNLTLTRRVKDKTPVLMSEIIYKDIFYLSDLNIMHTISC